MSHPGFEPEPSAWKTDMLTINTNDPKIVNNNFRTTYIIRVDRFFVNTFLVRDRLSIFDPSTKKSIMSNSGLEPDLLEWKSRVLPFTPTAQNYIKYNSGYWNIPI